MQAIVKRDICDDIKKDDKVEILPEYTYMIGSSVRIKEYFNLKSGEVVIRKTIKHENKDDMIIVKCSRKDVNTDISKR